MCNNNGVRDCRESFWKLVSRMCVSTFSMMKQSNLNTEIEWEAKHYTIVSRSLGHRHPADRHL